MLDSGLLERTDYGFKTTPKGDRFLALYSELYSMIGSQVIRRTIDERLLANAKDYAYRLKQNDKEKGFLLLEGKSKKVLDATCYYIVAKKEGIKISISELSRLFHVSPNSISRMKKIISKVESELQKSQEIKSSFTPGKGY